MRKFVLSIVMLCLMGSSALAQSQEQWEKYDEAHNYAYYCGYEKDEALGIRAANILIRKDATDARQVLIDDFYIHESQFYGIDQALFTGDGFMTTGDLFRDDGLLMEAAGDINLGAGDSCWGDEDYAGAVLFYEDASVSYDNGEDKFYYSHLEYSPAQDEFQTAEMEAGYVTKPSAAQVTAYEDALNAYGASLSKKDEYDPVYGDIMTAKALADTWKCTDPGHDVILNLVHAQYDSAVNLFAAAELNNQYGNSDHSGGNSKRTVGLGYWDDASYATAVTHWSATSPGSIFKHNSAVTQHTFACTKGGQSITNFNSAATSYETHDGTHH